MSEESFRAQLHRLEAIERRLGEMISDIKDIREHMLTKGDLHPSNCSRGSEWRDSKDGHPLNSDILAEIEYSSWGKLTTEIVACYVDSTGDLKTLGGDDIGWDASVIRRWRHLPKPDDSLEEVERVMEGER